MYMYVMISISLLIIHVRLYRNIKIIIDNQKRFSRIGISGGSGNLRRFQKIMASEACGVV